MKRGVVVAALAVAAGCTNASPPAGSDAAPPSREATSSIEMASPVPPETPDPVEERPLPGVWLVWTLGGVPAGLADRIRVLPGVRAVAEVASGTIWSDQFGNPEDLTVPPGDLAFPVEVAGVRPAELSGVFGDAAPPLLDSIRGNDVLLGRSWARLHGLRRRANVAADPGTYVSLHVAGVVADALVGGHEIVASRERAARLGVWQVRYLLVRAPEVSAPAFERRVRALVPSGVPLRIRAPGEADFLRHADLTLPQSRLKALFGEFAGRPDGGWLDVERSWERRNIVEDRVPILGHVTCHRRVVPLVRGALGELVERGLANLIDPAQYGGCYAPRFIGRDPGAGLSHHAWGVAIDINVADNPLGAEPTMDPRVVRTFERWGFVWGGDFIRPDGHHFEFRCFPEQCA